MKKAFSVCLKAFIALFCVIFIASCGDSGLKGKYFVADLEVLPSLEKDLLYFNFDIEDEGSKEKIGDRYVYFSKEKKVLPYTIDKGKKGSQDVISLKKDIKSNSNLKVGNVVKDSILMEVEINHGLYVEREVKNFKKVSKDKFNEILGYYVDGKNVNFK